MRKREVEYFNTKEYAQTVSSAFHDSMKIATAIFRDIMVHVFDISDTDKHVVWGFTKNNDPAFAFPIPSRAEDEKKFNAFWETLTRTKLIPNDNIWTYDTKNKAISLESIEYIPDLIRAFLGTYGGPRKKPTAINSENTSIHSISEQDLQYIDNRAFLGETDFKASFQRAIKESGETIYRHFLYSLDDLDKSIKALQYTSHGITNYPTEDVFRFQ